MDFFAIIILTLLNSCIISQNFNAENTVEEATTRTPAPGREGWLQLTIQNNAPNTVIHIDSLILCNILAVPINQHSSPTIDTGRLIKINLLKGLGYITLPCGSEANIPKTKIAEQKLSHWAPYALPNETNETLLAIYGEIAGISNNAADSSEYYTICSSPMYTALSGSILHNQTTLKTVSFYPDSPIYTIQNGTMIKILKEMTFSPYVAPW